VGGLSGELLEEVVQTRYEGQIRSDRHRFIIFDGSVAGSSWELDGRCVKVPPETRGTVGIVPAGVLSRGELDPRALGRRISVFLDPKSELIDPELRFAETEMPARLFFDDRNLRATAEKLKQLALDPASYGALGAESLGCILAIELQNWVLRTRRYPEHIHGGLAGWQERATREYIETNLAKDITLVELAGVARLSPYHFARAFKTSVGASPHRYHLLRRVDRAKQLLSDPDLSVAQIAAMVGFKGATQFGSTFRRLTGMTPTAYRREQIGAKVPFSPSEKRS
jgi:AraC family transcriptional regulator